MKMFGFKYFRTIISVIIGVQTVILIYINPNYLNLISPTLSKPLKQDLSTKSYNQATVNPKQSVKLKTIDNLPAIATSTEAFFSKKERHSKLSTKYSTDPITNKADGCEDWKNDFSTTQLNKPRIQLNPNKFLYPYPPWGPNNQMGTFINAVYLSIQLNR